MTKDLVTVYRKLIIWGVFSILGLYIYRKKRNVFIAMSIGLYGSISALEMWEILNISNVTVFVSVVVYVYTNEKIRLIRRAGKDNTPSNCIQWMRRRLSARSGLPRQENNVHALPKKDDEAHKRGKECKDASLLTPRSNADTSVVWNPNAAFEADGTNNDTAKTPRRSPRLAQK